jgi:hypothetical protein
MIGKAQRHLVAPIFAPDGTNQLPQGNIIAGGKRLDSLSTRPEGTQIRECQPKLLVVECQFRRGNIAFTPSIHWLCEPAQEAFNVGHALADRGQCPDAAGIPLPYSQVLDQPLKIICRQSMAVSEQVVQRCIQPVLAERVEQGRCTQAIR